jgi:hypothetical protein
MAWPPISCFRIGHIQSANTPRLWAKLAPAAEAADELVCRVGSMALA